MSINAYMCELHRQRDELLAAQKERKETTLPERITSWFASLPETEKRPAYKMKYFIDAIGEPASVIGPALHDLGWTRVRSWQPGASFSRFWIPPDRELEKIYATARDLPLSTSALSRIIKEWWEELPANEKCAVYTEKELALTFGRPPEEIAAAMRALNWKPTKKVITGIPITTWVSRHGGN